MDRIDLKLNHSDFVSNPEAYAKLIKSLGTASITFISNQTEPKVSNKRARKRKHSKKNKFSGVYYDTKELASLRVGDTWKKEIEDNKEKAESLAASVSGRLIYYFGKGSATVMCSHLKDCYRIEARRIA